MASQGNLSNFDTSVITITSMKIQNSDGDEEDAEDDEFEYA